LSSATAMTATARKRQNPTFHMGEDYIKT
jgi:hypothetical protein